MSPQVWLSLAGIAIQIVIGAYVYGKLTQQVAGHSGQHAAHDSKFKELDAEQGRQWETIGKHGERISAVEARCQANHNN